MAGKQQHDTSEANKAQQAPSTVTQLGAFAYCSAAFGIGAPSSGIAHSLRCVVLSCTDLPGTLHCHLQADSNDCHGLQVGIMFMM